MVWWLLAALLTSAALAAPYALYPLLLRLSPRRYALGQAPDPPQWPSVSIIVAAYNAAEHIGEKVRELRALDYPGALEIVVVDDCSADDTTRVAREAGADVAARLQKRGGKSEAQNHACELACGEVLVFTDAAVAVSREALRPLVRELMADGVGCVTGVDVSVAADQADAAAGAGFYTRMEIALRNREAETGTLLGVNGCLFAVRAELRPPVPASCVDDLYVPLAVADRGWRVTVAPAAKAVVRRAANLREEYRRKVRTFTGGLFTLRAARHDLPRAMRHLRWRLALHKVLRWLGPLFAALALYFSGGLAFRWAPGWILFLPQAAFWFAALVGGILTLIGMTPPRVLRLPLFFGTVQIALAHAWRRLAADRPFVAWEPTKRER
jgi:cellulose synthase/poly-beta-1,6-N-acetylglucosamine synthase-like glycosyltransferase